jgi:hypothetical protein
MSSGVTSIVYYQRMRPLLVASAALFGTVLVSACDSPLAPGECRDGHDSSGRGPFVLLQPACVPVGTDVQCHADRIEQGYCAGPTRDVTNLARWISTDSSAAFTTPGHLQVRAKGATAVYVEFESLYSQQVFGYLVEPGRVPEQIGVVDVSVWTTTTGGFLPLATVEFIPQLEVAQTCQQGVGSPFTPADFGATLLLYLFVRPNRGTRRRSRC